MPDVDPRWKSGPRPPAKRRPLPRASHKRLSEREQRAEVRRLTIERSGHRCQGPSFGLPGRCASPDLRRPELEVHETTARGTHPGSHLDPSCTVALCQIHHSAITEAVGELRKLCESVGTGKPTVHKHLTALRALGLVDWCDGRRGTLHVAHGVVAVGGEPYMAEPV